MSETVSLKEMINKLEDTANQINKLAIKLIQAAPLHYTPNRRGGMIFIGFSEYRWDKLPSDMRELQSNVIGKYRGWYMSSKRLIEKYFPEDLGNFTKYYEKSSKKSESLGVIDILQFRIKVWNNDKRDVVKEFEDIFSNQKNILSSIKYIETEEIFKILDKTEKISRESQEKELLKGSYEDLEECLVQIIYNYILLTPTSYKKSSRGISPQRKKFVKERDSFLCQICGDKLNEKELVVDHIFPYCFGGSNEEINLMALCKACNENKSKSLEYYRGNEGKYKIINNIRKFIRTLPIMHDFGTWLGKMGNAKRRVFEKPMEISEEST